MNQLVSWQLINNWWERAPTRIRLLCLDIPFAKALNNISECTPIYQQPHLEGIGVNRNWGIEPVEPPCAHLLLEIKQWISKNVRMCWIFVFCIGLNRNQGIPLRDTLSLGNLGCGLDDFDKLFRRRRHDRHRPHAPESWGPISKDSLLRTEG